ncbi:MAG: sugar kinase [Candidatus Dactylopiibacterium carminicum]|uniref:ROK family transcriptional regulator n=1 Tax=Candidatus Dactylopiibacterium carminicum TaxID=857335 RepID=A0A272ESB9_9RHOO|nr:ROK family transcriptional regulator [Candidatus Dactylopiibacterium carminicum]KAF7598771.1 ROK family transcriptional regulator [Candidatus Dactylopiibacterium carminicum]PAS92610.1 MAG: sugar kinase [Candidatus Dactylopiibacterium carminicum]PAS98794.1 MAG: hypothetical protein BSR46_11620 [Candidatus Dactylopiibacterium carminicum]
MAITGDQRLLKRINRMALVRLVRSRPGLSRADLAQETGLTKSTVSLLIQELIEEGWLRENEIQATGNIGRRPTPLCLNGHRLVVLGAELNADIVRVVVMSLAGEQLFEQQLDSPGEAPVEQKVRGLLDLLAEAVASLAPGQRNVLGLEVGVPGQVLDDDLVDAPLLGWHEVALGKLLRSGLARGPLGNVPVYILNNGDAAALGETEFISGEEAADPLLYIGLDQGISAGVIVGGRLLHGRRSFAGEVGHIQLLPEGPRCRCGRRGCAESCFGLEALAASLGCSMQELFARAQTEDPACMKQLSVAGKQLGMLLHNLWTVLDPARIVLGGTACRLGESPRVS